MTSKSKTSLGVVLKTKEGKELTNFDDIIEGVISDEGSVDFEIEINSPDCGPAEAQFYIEVEDGSPLSFTC